MSTQPDPDTVPLPGDRRPPVYVYPIMGVGDISDPSKAVPRLNIRDMAATDPNEDPNSEKVLRWNLFLQALTMLEASDGDISTEDTNHPLLYYQVSGIHGAPYIHWMEAPEKGDRPGDYCTHGSSLFLTWHRVYLLLFEQLIFRMAVKYAGEIQDGATRERYLEVAKTIRIPFWDWVTEPDLPDATRFPHCTITLPPHGTTNPTPVTRSVHNPLYSYRFKSALRRRRDFGQIQRTFETWIKWTETKRCPGALGDSQPHVVDAQMRGTAGIHPDQPRRAYNWRSGIYNLLANVTSFAAFSRTYRSGAPPVEYLSLEQYHNSVHVFTGNDLSRPPGNPTLGHMSTVGSAAFDPIFYLHHANVDRIYAMWQAIRFKSEFEGLQAQADRLPAIPSLTTKDDHKTPLRPFYTMDGRSPDPVLWDSAMVQLSPEPGALRRTFDMGYTYPEIPYIANEYELSDRVRTWVDENWGPREETFVAPGVKLDIEVDRKEVNVRRKGLDDAPHNWIRSPNLLGTFDTFKNESGACSNCASMEEGDQVLQSAIDITDSLYNALARERIPKLGSEDTYVTLIDVDEVEEYLKANLTWRAIAHNNQEAIDLKGSLARDNSAIRVRVASFYLKCPNWEVLKRTKIDWTQFGLVERSTRTHDDITNHRGLKEIGGW